MLVGGEGRRRRAFPPTGTPCSPAGAMPAVSGAIMRYGGVSRLISISTPARSSTGRQRGPCVLDTGCTAVVSRVHVGERGSRVWTPDTKVADMTRNESFKRRIRARMAKTDEKYGAARRALIAQAATPDARSWVADPEHSDAVIREHTDRGWDEWRDLIDAWPGHEHGHAAVASWLQTEHDVDGWWAQAVTVGWERITGRRLPNQMSDGTFTANRSATITIDPVALRELLLDDDARADLFPQLDPELRSRPTSKNIRVALGGGVAEIAIAAKGEKRATITVAHSKLSFPEDVAYWKAYWGDWLNTLDNV